MFKLEKVFQNDDSAYIIFVNFLKSFILFISIYVFSILEKNTIYDLATIQIFKNSQYFLYSILTVSNYFILHFFLNRHKEYKKNFISFLFQDVLNILISNFISFALFFIFKQEFILNINFIYFLLFIVFNLGLSKLFFNNLYEYLIDKNIIQKNIMLVGKYNDIKKLLKEKFDKIFVFKCCIILDIDDYNEKILKSEIKFPIFKNEDDIRSILEYHALGQIWMLESQKNKIKESFSEIIRFSVDILIINMNTEQNIKGKKLLGGIFDFDYYEISRFHGINLFMKILIDKIFSIIFIFFSTPIILISSILIFFTQNRTGWDGRRFKIYKLRTLKKTSFDKTIQVTKGDSRLLKIGKLIRKYSVDEIPQFLNVLLGDMSIVGPRPHMVEHDIQYSKLFKNFLKRHKCNPGLTGWAQVNGLRGATPNPENMKKRMEHDLWYMNNWTLILDIYIIFKTFYVVFKYKGD